MKVLKFGGSSLASADKILSVVEIIKGQSLEDDISVVVSAPGGVTNQLASIVDVLTEGDICSEKINQLKKHLVTIAKSVESNFEAEDNSLSDRISHKFIQLNRLAEGVKLVGHCPSQTEAQILTFGERLSVEIINWVFQQQSVSITIIDPEKFLTADRHSGDTLVNVSLSQQKFNVEYPDYSAKTPSKISLMPGFLGVSSEGTSTTLGRNGSDYSAAILAVCLPAKVCEIWTDVDGVYNADPRLVEDAKLVEKMTFNEAIELSYFGAKILHPKTITPLSLNNIPCLIKNTLAPNNTGTLISKQPTKDVSVKAIASLDDVAMINVSGPGMKAKLGLTNRIFSVLDKKNVQVILISQSSAAYRISLCVPSDQVSIAESALLEEFELELQNGRVDPLQIMHDLSVVSLVGDQMQQHKGIAAKFFSSLSQARVNIIAIAQDSSERSISAVVRSKRTDDAVSVCHRNLFNKRSTIDVFILGCGTVGSELIAQIKKQQSYLLKKDIELTLYGVASSKKLLLNRKGINLNSDWKQQLHDSNDVYSIERVSQFVSDHHLLNPVIVDVTSNEDIAMQSNKILEAKFHLVAANKKANTSSWEYYQKLRKTAQSGQRRFLYETNVGAGLPIIDNLQSLLGAGDELKKCEGILSGSLSYIFGLLHEGLTLSEATLQAKKLGYTEPNPAEDLSGLDVARKVLIIAREAGLKLELEDIQLESVVPSQLASIVDGDAFMKQLPEVDGQVAKLVQIAEQEDKVLRYIANIEDGQCKVGIQAVDANHPLFNIKNGENAIAMHTHYYDPVPFVIRGYGAGAAVTAAGLFADVLRTLDWDLK